MGLPPAESREGSLLAMGRVDTLDDIHTPDEFAKMLKLQQRATDAQFVILSDVHLDDADVVRDIGTLRDGIESAGKDLSSVADVVFVSSSQLTDPGVVLMSTWM